MSLRVVVGDMGVLLGGFNGCTTDALGDPNQAEAQQ